MEDTHHQVLLIADSHVMPQSADEAEFFHMLEAISASSYDVIFLGDNLDLWIESAPRYENGAHRRFLTWCADEKARRRVVFIEGNHEFYLSYHCSDAFSTCVTEVYRVQGVTYLHGDMVHRGLSFHRFFRWFAKNRIGDFIMRYLPFGVLFARVMKRLLSHHGKDESHHFPVEQIAEWTEHEAETSGNKLVVMGHFHFGISQNLPDGVRYQVIPAWKNAHEIGLLDEATGVLHIDHWTQLVRPQGA